MKSIVTAGATACLAVLLLSGMSMDESAPASVSESHDTGIPIERIITLIAKKTGKKFVVDPRVRAQVQLIGQDPSSLSYSEFLTVLQVHGFIAVDDSDGLIRVIPDAAARQVPTPRLSSGQTFPDAQVVTYVISVKNSPAAFLVPILRPMLPQMAQLVAYPCSNTLLIVDSFANVKRIEATVKALDTGSPYKPAQCEAPNPGAHHD